MRRFFFALLAVLFMVGIAYADGIPVATDPKNFATVWTQTVYNGSGDNITSGVAVRWDINASSTDLAMWVEQNDTVADIRTAGVVPYGHPLDNTTVGDIIVKGPAIMYDAGNTTTAGTGVEADANGYPVDETLAAADEALLGWCINANADTAANTDLNTAHYAVIFVQPTPYSD